jgi:UDP-N-acetylglucosamine 2-epimerase (non-hydrolysing)
MKRFEPIVLDYKPDFVLVVGDVNSTIACGLVAVKLGVKLVHVEAGLRSFDRTMPEEINRILTDSISDLLFVTEQAGVDNLKREGIDPEKINLVGNVMVDTLLEYREKAECSSILKQLDLKTKNYAVITLHRPGNVDTLNGLEKIIKALEVIQKDIKLIFPMHPRTRKNITGSPLQARLGAMPNLILLEPTGYLDFIKLMAHAAVVLTDSGGIQAETTILQVPCITLRDNTEQPATITEGTNRLAGLTIPKILAEFNDIKGQNFVTSGKRPCLWDGRAAVRIADIIISTPNT